MSGSGDESGQGDLRFLCSNILVNHDLETTSQAFFLKMTVAFTAHWVVFVHVSNGKLDNGFLEIV